MSAENRFPSTREMARQIGTTLKKVQLRKDLHTVLARTVVEARQGLGLGVRTGDPSSATPIAQIVDDNTPRIDLAPVASNTPVPPIASQGALDKLRGLRHRLPFFGRKKA